VLPIVSTDATRRKEGLGFSTVIPDAVQHEMLHC
jgi:hypothetical protein